MPSSRTSHRVIDSLLYPAFLGNMSYLVLEKLFNTPDAYTKASASLAIALLLHYIMDWAYTLKAEGEPYYNLKFLLDLVIVVCLYVAIRLAVGDSIALFDGAWAPAKQPSFWLLLTKVCAVSWEFISSPKKKVTEWTKTRQLAAGTDFVAGIIYAGFLFSALNSSTPTHLPSGIALAIVVLFDAICYPLHDYWRRKWKNG